MLFSSVKKQTNKLVLNYTKTIHKVCEFIIYCGSDLLCVISRGN